MQRLDSSSWMPLEDRSTWVMKKWTQKYVTISDKEAKSLRRGEKRRRGQLMFAWSFSSLTKTWRISSDKVLVERWVLSGGIWHFNSLSPIVCISLVFRSVQRQWTRSSLVPCDNFDRFSMDCHRSSRSVNYDFLSDWASKFSSRSDSSDKEVPAVMTHRMWKSKIFDKSFLLAAKTVQWLLAINSYLRFCSNSIDLFDCLSPMSVESKRWRRFSRSWQFAKRYWISLNIISLGIEHTNGKRCLKWNVCKFLNPKKCKMICRDTEEKMFTISDPHDKKDDEFHIYFDKKARWYLVVKRRDADYGG